MSVWLPWPRDLAASRAADRRCDLGCLTWPDDRKKYGICPICGEPTTRYRNVEVSDEDEGTGGSLYRLPDSDPRKPMVMAYLWLGALQETLVEALMPD